MPPSSAKPSIHFLSAALSVTSSAAAGDARLLGLPVLLALFHELGVARAEAHDRALGHKSIDDGAADALGAAGDQNALALQTELHVSSDSCRSPIRRGIKQGSGSDVQAIRPFRQGGAGHRRLVGSGRPLRAHACRGRRVGRDRRPSRRPPRVSAGGTAEGGQQGRRGRARRDVGQVGERGVRCRRDGAGRDRHRGEQRRHLHRQARARDAGGGLGRRRRHQPARRLAGGADRGQALGRRQASGRHRQHRLDPGPAHDRPGGALQCLEGGPHPSHARARHGMGAPRHPRERDLPRLYRDGDEQRLLEDAGRPAPDRAHPPAPHRPARASRRRAAAAGLRGRHLHDRQRAHRRWRAHGEFACRLRSPSERSLGLRPRDDRGVCDPKAPCHPEREAEGPLRHELTTR